MNSDILVSVERLDELIESRACTVVDCRFDFARTGKGRLEWLAGHIPGASYAHLDDDLAAPIVDHSGRHPLPETSEFAAYLSSIGWSGGRLLVAYDEGSNAVSARLWWMMRYYGQPSALLDGGLAAWKDAGLPLESGEPDIESAAEEQLEPDEEMALSTAAIMDQLDSPDLQVLDARAIERFTGKNETLDTKAGHIPGSLNRPFSDNLGADGRFLPPQTLRAQFEEVLGGAGTQAIVHSCGSGVTACHNLFAMELAGLGRTRLYPGSWSEWIRDPRRPIAVGESL